MAGMFDFLFSCSYFEQSIRAYCCHDHAAVARLRLFPFAYSRVQHFVFSDQLFLRLLIITFSFSLVHHFIPTLLFYPPRTFVFYNKLSFIILMSRFCHKTFKSLFRLICARLNNIAGAFHQGEKKYFSLPLMKRYQSLTFILKSLAKSTLSNL